MNRRDNKALPIEFHDPALAQLQVESIDEPDVLAGDPLTRYAALERAGDGTEVGLRDFSAGRFRRAYPSDEVLHVVEGSAGVIDENHRAWALRPGDVVTFRQGSVALWQVPEYLRVLSVVCPPRKPPLARRALQAMTTASAVVATLTLIGVTTVAGVAASVLGT
jgi:uncharacterized cupin superfamily protein